MLCHLAKNRFRFRKADGSPDYTALNTFHLAIKHALDLTPAQKSRLLKSRERVAKMDGISEAGVSLFPIVAIDGIQVFIDRPKGFVQTGEGPDGVPWQREFLCNYGFFPDTIGADNEEVDVYLGDDLASPRAFLIRQVRQDGTFDEHKVMIGFCDEAAALRMYLAHTPAWCFGGMCELPLAFLAELLRQAPEATCMAMEKSVYVAKTLTEIQSMLLVEKRDPEQDDEEEDDQEDDAEEKALKARIAACSKQHARCYAALPKSIRKALEAGAAGYSGTALPLGSSTTLTDHPALTSPLTWDYDNPEQVGGWMGAIEPQDASWIAFVDIDGHGLLWTQRDETGGVVGVPYKFERPDLVQRIDYAPPGARDASPQSPTNATKEPSQAPAQEPVETPAAKETTTSAAVPHALPGGSTGTVKPEDLPPHVTPGAPIPIAQPAKKRMWKSIRKTAEECHFTFVGKSLDTDSLHRLVFGIVLEPEPFNGAGDAHNETYSAEEIRSACYEYMAFYRNLDDQHGAFIPPDKARVVEGYCALQDFTYNNQLIKKDTWLMRVHIPDDELWNKVLTGEWNAFSIEGYGERIEDT